MTAQVEVFFSSTVLAMSDNLRLHEIKPGVLLVGQAYDYYEKMIGLVVARYDKDRWYTLWS
jgi:hypothetical protein